MKSSIKRILSAAVALSVATQPAQAALLTLASQPIYLGAAIPPVVMLNVGRDHQLHYKAYTDYSDLDEDGVLETTYKHTITYYGYFDSFKCYTYSSSNNRFEPFGATANKYCEGANAGRWAGNFLNWVSMTRIDAVRKLLYGGLRSTDTATNTVLERSYLPPDAHSFAKFYGGKDEAGTDDFHKLTPFTSSDIRTTTNTTVAADNITIGSGSKTFNVVSVGNLAPLVIGDAVKARMTASPTNFMIGRVTAIAGSAVTIDVDANTGSTGAGSAVAWTIENLTQVGVSFCNVTMGATTGAQQLSQTNTNPPLLKAARGNFSLWSSMERYQCHWDEDSSNPGKGAAFVNTRWNGNVPSASGIFSNAGEPSTGTHRLGGTDFIVRVQVCVSTLLGTEKCKEYATNNAFKPIGLVQTYGEPGLLRFGLMTGSYAKNMSGGVLRKNPGALSDEITVGRNLQFAALGGTHHRHAEPPAAVRLRLQRRGLRQRYLPDFHCHRRLGRRQPLAVHRRQLLHLGQPDVGDLPRVAALLRRRLGARRLHLYVGGVEGQCARLAARHVEQRRQLPQQHQLLHALECAEFQRGGGLVRPRSVWRHERARRHTRCRDAHQYRG